METALEDTLDDDPNLVARRLRQAPNMGAWLKVQLSTVNGT